MNPIVLGFFALLAFGLVIVIMFISYKTEQNKAIQRAEYQGVAEEHLETAKDTKEVVKKALGQIAQIKDPQALWIANQLSEEDKSGIPMEVTIPLRKKKDPNYLLLVPLFLQKMQLEGFVLVADGRLQRHFENMLLFCFERDAERFVLSVNEQGVEPAMVFNIVSDKIADLPNLPDWVEFEGHLAGQFCLGQSPLLSTSEDCDGECRITHFEIVRKIIDECKVEVRYPEGDKTFTLYRPASRYGGNILERVPVSNMQVPEKVFGLSYSNPSIQGKEMPLGELFTKLVELMKIGRFNGAVTGTAGMGKTHLSKYFARLLHGAGIRTMISEDKFPFENSVELARAESAENPLLWIIEDAHRLSLENLSVLANLMDGSSTPEKLSILVLYNPAECKPETLQMLTTAIERPGRIGVKIETKALSAEKGKELRETILALMPELVEAQPLKEGEVSLADVWASLCPKVVKDLMSK